ncbi:MAG TPA: hypothetical protein VFB07_06650 [Vicinamibacterales bacterium]|nr:hypothetical protein [Vicinamibacterales bacterium]
MTATFVRVSLAAGAIAALLGSPATAAPREDQSAGESCIALMLPTIQGIPGNAEEAASGIRDLLAKYLTGPSTKVVVLDSRLASQATAEAKQKGCEPILVSSVTRKSGGGGFTKALGQAAGASSWYIPGGATVGSAAARAAASAGLQTAASLASSTKAKDEMKLEFRLQTASGQTQFGPKTEAQKASVDGEDLLTPIVMRAAEAIVARKGTK